MSSFQEVGIGGAPLVAKDSVGMIFCFCSQLLKRHPPNRLGGGPEDARSIKEHSFFKHFNWDALLQCKVDPPYSVSVVRKTKIGRNTISDLLPSPPSPHSSLSLPLPLPLDTAKGGRHEFV